MAFFSTFNTGSRRNFAPLNETTDPIVIADATITTVGAGGGGQYTPIIGIIYTNYGAGGGGGARVANYSFESGATLAITIGAGGNYTTDSTPAANGGSTYANGAGFELAGYGGGGYFSPSQGGLGGLAGGNVTGYTVLTANGAAGSFEFGGAAGYVYGNSGHGGRSNNQTGTGQATGTAGICVITYPGTQALATGGTITIAGGIVTHTFTAVGSSTFTVQ